ncbi:homoserine O-acetyltransferase [Thozetella sp. PMI_491]|nr:homoserine O-acetyltransferase [Thozetella sp. PMI_491]
MVAFLDSDPRIENFYASLISDQKFALIDCLSLESGDTIIECPVAYKTWGRLNDTRDNVLVICHALTGSSDAGDWWEPLMGPGRAFDPQHFFIFCANVLGSPYGSASPLTLNARTGQPWGPDFPRTTVRDDVGAQKQVLDALGIKSVAAVIGGSMGGMITLEWPLCTPPGYVKSIVPIATAADHSAWGISWSETQRQCIYSDPKFQDGRYNPTPEGQPSAGLAAARMIAMLTYRSCVSFDTRFGRKPQRIGSAQTTEQLVEQPATDGRRAPVAAQRKPKGTASFSAQGYLHYQGQKFIRRFDANCYLHITHKMDTHDVARGRAATSEDDVLRRVLGSVPRGALVIGIATDTLFIPEQQKRLSAYLPNSSLEIIDSDDGHDGFLLEFEQLDKLIQGKLRSEFSKFYSVFREVGTSNKNEGTGRESLTGEVEQWCL